MASEPELPLHLLQKKQQMRNALRQEYWKKVTEPPRSPNVKADFLVRLFCTDNFLY